MLRKFLQPRINDQGNGPLWFQQHGATAHTARISRGVLGQLFPGCIVSLHGDIPQLAHSPDLSPYDFFLWGHLKSGIFRGKPQMIEALKKDSIRNAIAAIPQEMTRGASRSDYSSASLGKVNIWKKLSSKPTENVCQSK